MWGLLRIGNKGATLASLQNFHILNPNPIVNTLGPKIFHFANRSLDFGISLILDPSAKLPKVVEYKIITNHVSGKF